MYYFTITHEINWCSSITIIYFYHINSYIYLSLNQTGLRDSVNVFSQISLNQIEFRNSNWGIRFESGFSVNTALESGLNQTRPTAL
jgi:hypothetical protein